jgi:hypothetical protein
MDEASWLPFQNTSAIIVEEAWRSVSISAEVSARIMEKCFMTWTFLYNDYVVKSRSPANHLEEAAIPQVNDIINTVKKKFIMIEFKMPSLGADMEDGTLIEWKKKPGDMKRGDIIAEVENKRTYRN